MQSSPKNLGLRSRSVTAALVTLGCSLGVNVSPLLATPAGGQSQMSAEQSKGKITADQQKHLKTDQDQVSADQARLKADQDKLAAMKYEWTPAQQKGKANQEKLAAAEAKVATDKLQLKADQDKLAADQQKFPSKEW